MIRSDVIANMAALIIRRSKQKIERSQVAHGCLSVDVELAQRIDFIAEEFQTERQGCLPRIDIENAAANGELPSSRNLGNTLVTASRELVEKFIHVDVCAAPQLHGGRLERARTRGRLIETCPCGHDDTRAVGALEFHEQRQPFGRNLGIGQNIFNGGKLSFRKKKRVWLPVEQCFVKQLLRMNAGTEHPDR